MSEHIACSRCGEMKPPSEYYKTRRQCKACVLAINRTYRLSHRDEISARRAIYTTTAEFKQRRLENQRARRDRSRLDIYRKHAAWRKANPERIAQYRQQELERDPDAARRRTRKWLEQNRDRAAQKADRWRRENPEAYQLSRRNRAMRRRALEKDADTGAFSVQQLRERIAFYGGKCWICQVADYEHLDHVKPLSKGGPNLLANLRPACRSCNEVKAARWLGTDQIKELVADVILRSGSIRPTEVRGRTRRLC